MKLPNENAEKDAEKDKAEKQPNDKDSPSDDDKRSEGMYFSVFTLFLRDINEQKKLSASSVDFPS